MDGFIKIHDGTWFLVLFGPERYITIYDGNRYLTSEKSDILNSINYKLQDSGLIHIILSDRKNFDLS